MDQHPQNVDLNPQPSNPHPNDPHTDSQHLDYMPQEDDTIDQEEIQLSSSQSHNPELRSQDSHIYPIYQKKALKVIKFFIYCLPFINFLSLCLLSYSFSRQEETQSEISYGTWLFNKISADLTVDPIMEIQLIDMQSTCPSGFQPLQLAEWRGTVSGCLCNNGDLHRTLCEEISSAKCKIDIPETDPLEMYAWDDSIFCVKRAVLGTDYLRQAECPSDYQECYPGGCFKGDCPVTKLEIAPTGPTANKFISKEKYLVLSKAQGELPLIDIQITLGDIPCFPHNSEYKALGGLSYELSRGEESNCGEYGRNSHFSTKLDSQTTYDLFTQNLLHYRAMHLPSFQENVNASISVLFSTVRMKTAKHEYCQDMEADAQLIGDYYYTWLLPPILNSLGLAFAPFPLIILVCVIQDSWIEPGIEFYLKDRISVAYLIACIFLIPRVAWTFDVWQKFLRLKEAIEGYETLKCFEGGRAGEEISDYMVFLKKVEGDFWIYFLFWFANISSILAWGCYYYVRRKTRRNSRV